MSRYRGPGDPRRPHLIFAVCMIGAGILLFLANLGFLPINNVWDYWPLIFVASGLGKLSGARRPAALIFGGMFVVLGLLFTLINTGVFRLRAHDDGSWPLSIVFLALGLGGLARIMDRGVSPWQRRGFMDASFPPAGPPDASASGSTEGRPSAPAPEAWHQQRPERTDNMAVLDNFALMGSVNRKVESVNLQGGTLTSFLGSIDIDLRRSRLPQGRSSIAIDANAFMGSIKLRIPETWRVEWNGVNIMGNFEDKTVPPNTGAAAPQLILTGYSVMASVEVES